MPKAALDTGCVDLMLPLQDIAPLLVNLVRDGHPLAAARETAATLLQSRHLSVSPELKSALWYLLAHALATQRTDLGNIQLVDPQTGTLGIVTQRGFGLDFLEYFRTVDLESNSACGRAMRDRAPVLIGDVVADPLFAMHRHIAHSAGFRSVQSTPLISRGGAFLGVLSTHFRNMHRFTDEELKSLEFHARYGADMIEMLNV